MMMDKVPVVLYLPLHSSFLKKKHVLFYMITLVSPDKLIFIVLLKKKVFFL